MEKTDAEGGKKKAGEFRFPSAYTIVALVAVAVWVAAFFIPTGSYSSDPDTGRPVPGSYEQTDVEISLGDRLYDLFMAPIHGLFGVQSEETGVIGAYEIGELFGSAGVFLFVLAVGMFITITMKSGAIDAGLGRVSQKFGGRGIPLIVILMVLFALGGTTMGMAEETLGFYALVVPIMLSLGYDRLVAASVILFGAGIGTLASTFNPFATGVASDAADISMGQGVALRTLMLIALTAITIGYVARYAHRVKRDPDRSLMGIDPNDKEKVTTVPDLTVRHKVILTLLVMTFAMMIFSIVPWSQIFQGPEADSYVWQLDWYFPELAALFVVMAIVVGLVAGMNEKTLTSNMVSGAGDFISAGLIIILARGVTVIMNNSEITDTILNALENAIAGAPGWLFGPLMFLLNVPLAFLVPSSSGHAALAMPVLAPLADFAGLDREVVVTAFQSASGWINLFTPTSAVVMGGLALAKVGYGTYLRFIGPLLGILALLIIVFLTLDVFIALP